MPNLQSEFRRHNSLPAKVSHVDEIHLVPTSASDSTGTGLSQVSFDTPRGPKPDPMPTTVDGKSGETLRSRVRGKSGLLCVPLGLWIVNVIFAVLYSLYVYHVVILVDPRLGSLLMSASDTNLVVSIVSQVFAQLTGHLIGGVLDTLRWQLASRTDGISFSTFFQLSGATEWTSILTFTMASGLRNLSGVFR